jgi:hypothetical protein
LRGSIGQGRFVNVAEGAALDQVRQSWDRESGKKEELLPMTARHEFIDL